MLAVFSVFLASASDNNLICALCNDSQIHIVRYNIQNKEKEEIMGF